MWDIELTDVTVNDWRGLEDTVRTWERIIPHWIWMGERKNEANDEGSGENCPDNGGYFAFPGRVYNAQGVVRGCLDAQEGAPLASWSCSPFCVTGSHGMSRGCNQAALASPQCSGDPVLIDNWLPSLTHGKQATSILSMISHS